MQRVHEISRRRHVLGKTAVSGPSGKFRCLTEIFSTGKTEPAFAARGMQPSNADTVPDTDPLDVAAGFFDCPNDLVSRDHRRESLRKFAFDDVKIGPADSARTDLDQNFTRPGNRAFDLRKDKRPSLDRSRLVKQTGSHWLRAV